MEKKTEASIVYWGSIEIIHVQCYMSHSLNPLKGEYIGDYDRGY